MCGAHLCEPGARRREAWVAQNRSNDLCVTTRIELSNSLSDSNWQSLLDQNFTNKTFFAQLGFIDTGAT